MELIIVGAAKSLSKSSDNLVVKYRDSVASKVEMYKYLGVLIDNTSWISVNISINPTNELAPGYDC